MGVRGSWRIGVTLVVLSVALIHPVGAAQFEDIGPSLSIPGAIGAAWGDYDGDGYPDLAITGNQALGYGTVVLHNNGDLTFTDVRQTLGVPLTFDGEITPAWADYDNDGKLDLFVASDGPVVLDKLYDNTATAFIDTASAAGFTTFIGSGQAARTVSWGDYNNDNRLDVFICLTLGGGMSRLCRNNGDGTFTDVTQQAGIIGTAAAEDGNCSAWGDYDNDGWLDLLVTRADARPMLYHNQHDGTFTEVGGAFFGALTNMTAVAWADYDNDGWLDCYFASIAEGRGWLFHNNHDRTFTDVSEAAGIAGDSVTASGAAWADYDNDGYLDLFVANLNQAPLLYHNNGDGTFTNVAAAEGITGAMTSESACWADIDLDGKLDLFQGVEGPNSRLFHNIGPVGNWLRVRALTSRSGDATGNDPVRDAIGARVDLNLDSDEAFPTGAARTLMRVIDGGSGFLSQNEQIAQFGLADAATVAVRVRFPDGSVVMHKDVAANQQITIKDVPAGYVEIFPDVPLDYWSYPQVKAVEDANIVKGYSDGTYKPTDPVTRDQMAVYISRALAGGDAAVPTGPATGTFSDVPTDYWAFKYVEYAAAQNVVQGYSDGTYKPTDQVDRGQMAVFIARSIYTPTAARLNLTGYTPPATATFPDVPTTFWAYEYVEYIAQPAIGVTKGYPDGDYHPEYVCTRDQMAVYIQRAFQLPL
jgi:hypothetical protein